MKRNRITAGITLLLLVMCACLSHAQSAKTYGVTEAWDFKHHSFGTYVPMPTNARWDVGALTAGVPDLPKFHFTVDVAPWAGPGAAGNGALGYQVSHSFAITKDGKWTASLGVLGSFEKGKLPDFYKAFVGFGVSIG